MRHLIALLFAIGFTGCDNGDDFPTRWNIADLQRDVKGLKERVERLERQTAAKAEAPREEPATAETAQPADPLPVAPLPRTAVVAEAVPTPTWKDGYRIRLQAPGMDQAVRVRNRKGKSTRIDLRDNDEKGPVLIIRSAKAYTFRSTQVGDSFRRRDARLGWAYTLRLAFDDERTFDPDDLFVDLTPSDNDQTFWFTTLRSAE